MAAILDPGTDFGGNISGMTAVLKIVVNQNYEQFWFWLDKMSRQI